MSARLARARAAWRQRHPYRWAVRLHTAPWKAPTVISVHRYRFAARSHLTLYIENQRNIDESHARTGRLGWPANYELVRLP